MLTHPTAFSMKWLHTDKCGLCLAQRCRLFGPWVASNLTTTCSRNEKECNKWCNRALVYFSAISFQLNLWDAAERKRPGGRLFYVRLVEIDTLLQFSGTKVQYLAYKVAVPLLRTSSKSSTREYTLIQIDQVNIHYSVLNADTVLDGHLVDVDTCTTKGLSMAYHFAFSRTICLYAWWAQFVLASLFVCFPNLTVCVKCRVCSNETDILSIDGSSSTRSLGRFSSTVRGVRLG